mmetsp:Transcript_18123/g.21719  ORF Transcript_18123/g.21719 Transcript_18123/m.21719 type:complete len:288 (-) Transcript_18123:45-908(-)|eukprot:CAMPEP_0197843720 /NCGR_PEP_ID=MMETSP1438-20131217/649_1 /TAXON_ID=1461541 /ORGANISM="Pterosperma sp., Strain CCMP1384" /LENGTH=287 /DNA_ID=CAMNT_0043454065 /DNA_START=283 /DNA_END=1146 /DNA_ORIENTATION=+
MGAEGWNHPGLHVASEVAGWAAFTVWTISFYPQAILNWKRKSVVGLNFDFLAFNITKHSVNLFYNSLFTLSVAMRTQYREKHGEDAIIPVTASDLAFAIHAVAMTLFQIGQCFYYPRANQKISKTGMFLVFCAWGVVLAGVGYSAPYSRWLWLASALGLVLDVLTGIKYTPQAYYNYKRKSTEGWSLSNVMMDLGGGLLIFVQMFIQSMDKGNFNNFRGGWGKLVLSLETMAFDIFFMVQHFILYPGSHKPKEADSTLLEKEEEVDGEYAPVELKEGDEEPLIVNVD